MKIFHYACRHGTGAEEQSFMWKPFFTRRTDILHINFQSGTILLTSSGTSEYCIYEQLEISCDTGEAILLTSAKFGRMNTGRCIANEYEENLGCFADVLDHLDHRLIWFIFKLRHDCIITWFHSEILVRGNILARNSFQRFSQVFR